MYWQGTQITDKAITIEIHKELTPTENIKKNKNTSSLIQDGEKKTLGGIKNPVIHLEGCIQNSESLTKDAQKRYICQWLDSGTEVYLISSAMNDRNAYAGMTEIIDQARYAPIHILSADFSRDNNIIYCALTIRLTKTDGDGYRLMAVENWETIPEPDMMLVDVEDYETIPEPGIELVAVEDWE